MVDNRPTPERLRRIADGYERHHEDIGASHWFRLAAAEIERLRALNEQMADAMDSTINGLRGLENTLRIAGYPSEARNLETKIGSLRLVASAARQEPSHG